MAELPARLDSIIPLVDARISLALESRSQRWAHLPHASEELIGIAAALTAGGKRLRAVLASIGYASLRHRSADAQRRARFMASQQAISLGAALELYQASALIHDDVIDDAPTRRGQAATHIRLSELHQDSDWLGSASTFGRSGAVLLGDLMLSAAMEVMDEAAQVVADANPSGAHEARAAFNAMTAEVAVGQYLDLRAEMLPLPTPEEDPTTAGLRMEREALTVVIHKSARYSVMHPLVIGALLSGAIPYSPALSALSRFGEELGVAFQLRDDELGVFGDPQVTGKPAGGDLVEGKRTVLLGQAWRRTDAAGRELLRTVLGNSEATAEQLAEATALIERCGARAELEERIADVTAAAMRTLEGLRSALHPAAAEDLRAMTSLLTDRRA
ncbi:Octaprenyl-diphosphate synthase [Actinomyces bovis]|uniref:Octaprenyl-diphosphate synthase n=1 Tax=Actinomyces bovis TaxID=1658 RepID=A0ABY1VK45_9ACTO|nr:polyprenyl synthetase family protein [Actinomyces bovis]SPT52450.1 Octaprenyl-diphosphate synthase [Actinomyces bovis]VEG54110.1 Octaprenyl-diphosphate synthase [Actinomyces israelii]